MRLGPFELIAPLGEGGTGVVWAGRHVEQGVDVAVKVLTESAAREEHWREGFRREVRAAAGLDHPAIVTVLDFGEVGEGGPAPAGSPYLVMERCQGSLTGWRGPWAEVRDVLLALLDGLAHAHARGVVHRDLKPGNVLRGGLRSPVVLADFGIAHAGDQESPTNAVSGTPTYMAPEQWAGTWREQGPWSDLYALGGLAWSLVAGRPPFGRGKAEQLAERHLRQPLRRLSPVIPIPEGLEDWLRLLLAKDPLERYRNAADAAADLLRLGDAVGEPAAVPGLRPSEIPTLTLDVAEVGGPAPAPASSGGRVGPRLAVPADWRRPEAPTLPVRIVGAGLRLLGLRPVALVDREPERDALWKALRRVATLERPELVVVSGSAGVGKSALVAWLAERARELGAAEVLHAHHAPEPGPGHGLRGLVRRALCARGLEGEELVEHCRRWVAERPLDDEPQGDGDALAALLGHGEGVLSSAERAAVLGRLCRRLGRPVVLWVDDVHYAVDTLPVLARLVRFELPVLVVGTVRDDALVERPVEAEQLELLGATELEVGPLPAASWPELARAIVVLDPEASAVLEARAAGNPQLAGQLVADWGARDLLEVGPRGFRLRPGADGLPADLEAAWSARVERLVGALPAGGAEALELAAVLGLEVVRYEWQEACAIAGLRARWGVVEAVVDAGLARTAGPDRVVLAHGMLREALVARAHRGGRLARLHGACAEVVGRAGGHDVRVALHLVAAGRAGEALDPLLGGIRRVVAEGRLGLARHLLSEWGRAMLAADVPVDDVRWAEGWVYQALASHLIGRNLDEALGWCQQAWALLEGTDSALLPTLCKVHAQILLARGDVAGSEALARRGLELARACGSVAEEAGILGALASTLGVCGRLDEVEEILQQRLALARAHGLDRLIAHSRELIGVVKMRRGELDRAEEELEAAAAGYRALGMRHDQANAAGHQGEVARHRGDLDAAEAHYREAMALRAASGVPTIIEEVNLGLVLIDRGARVEGGRVLLQCLERSRALRMPPIEAQLHALVLPGLADDPGPEFEEHLATARRALAAMARADVDVARMAELAGRVAREAGMAERASVVWSWAAEQYEQLGMTRDAERVRGLG